MTKAIKQGRKGWASITTTANFRRRFALAMHERSHVLAPVTIESFRLPRQRARFLDLGGGSGSYSIALVRRFPELRGMVVDQSVAVARRLISREGLDDRIQVQQGDVLTRPLARSMDVVLLSNLLHDFSEQENLRLLRRVHKSLRPGGKVYLVDFFLNETGTLPAEAAVFSLLMYTFTATGRSYAWKEVEAWLKSTGFCRSRRHAVTESIGTLEAMRL